LIGRVTSATRRHLAAVSASGLYENRKSLITRKRWQLDEKCLQNTNSKTGRPIEWSSYFRKVAPPTTDSSLRSVLATRKSADNLQMAGASRGMCTQQQIQVDPSDGQATSAWRRHLSPISALSGIPCITRDGESRTSSVHRTQIGNRRRSVELCSDSHYDSPLPTDFHFWSVFAKGSKASDCERYQLDDDCSQKHKQQPRSAYRMVKLLS
jgi:hypothetical protein